MLFHKRIPFAEREKDAYLILRKKGLSINQMAKAFGRSTSVIHRVFMKAEQRGIRFLDVWKRRLDLRKLKRGNAQTHARMRNFRWHKMLTLLSQWEAWICGEGDRPP